MDCELTVIPTKMSALGVNSDFVLYSESGKIKKIPELSTLHISQEKEGKVCIILFSGIWIFYLKMFSSSVFLHDILEIFRAISHFQNQVFFSISPLIIDDEDSVIPSQAPGACVQV